MTTICAVKKDNQVAMAGDGQVTMGEKVIMKGTARKIRRIFDNQVLVGFAGGVADAITLEEMFGILTIGSGGNFALAAARGLLRFGDSSLTAEDIARESLKIASEIDIFTNDNIITETLA